MILDVRSKTRVPMRYLNTAVIIVILSAGGCERGSPRDQAATPEAESEGRKDTKLLLLGNSTPTPGHEKIDSSEIGSKLEDAVRVFGPWDKVGDVMSDEEGQFYPFSDREGYDYLVRIGENDSINGVWRRKLNIVRSEQDAAPNP